MFSGLVVFTAFLVGVSSVIGQAASAADGPDTFKVIVVVTDKKGNFVKNIETARFFVEVDGEKQEVISSATVTEPFSIGLLFDVSNSMRRSGKLVRIGIESFLERAGGTHQYFVSSFADNFVVVQDFTSDREVVSRSLGALYEDLEFQSKTNLFEGVESGLDKLEESALSRKAMVVFSDGVPTIFSAKFEVLKKRLSKTEVRLYTVGFQRDGIGFDMAQGLWILDALASSTGGVAVLPSTEEWSGGRFPRVYPGGKREFREVFARIGEELNSLYELKFRINEEVLTRMNQESEGLRLKVSIIRKLPGEQKKMEKLRVRTRPMLYPKTKSKSAETN